MKKLMYLFVAGTMFAFTACGGGETATEEAAPAVEETVETATEDVAEGVGCQIGEPCVEDHSCCMAHEESAEGEEAEATEEESHEGHNHE